ncbi:ricin B-like lectin EULS3 [Cryptomeria japonica]|uniref:ricin B-like lectin EULS3 n=1 Tax=Cryptomeria japonica TaxID=3369 RepID=UPI0025ABBF69|nr:ricin B-like lectin EULS3 [Cryptomeria japonica]
MASCQQYLSPHLQGQIVSGFCKPYPHLNLGITSNKENLVPSDCKLTIVVRNSSDPTQKWVIVETESNNDNDKNAFASVNASTGHAICAKDRIITLESSESTVVVGYWHVVVTEYKVDNVDKSVLWTLGEEIGDGFKNLISADGRFWTLESVDQGIKIMLRTSNGQDHQLGKFLPLKDYHII